MFNAPDRSVSVVNKKDRRTMKKLIDTAVAAAAMSIPLAGVAWADTPPEPGASGNGGAGGKVTLTPGCDSAAEVTPVPSGAYKKVLFGAAGVTGGLA
jgi:hypothetical protein